MANSKMKHVFSNCLLNETLTSMCYSKIASCLLNHNCNIEEQIPKEDINKLLHIAIKKKYQSAVKVLVKIGADIYFKDETGNTALTLSKIYADKQVYNSLIYTEVDTNSANIKDTASYYKICIILLLIESVYSNYFPTLYYTHELICCDPINMALLLLNNNLIIKEFFQDVYLAVDNGFEEIVNIILSNGVDINVRDKFGRLLLHSACHQGNIKAVEFLLNINVNIDMLDAYQRSALHTAVVAGQIEIVKLLMDKGANINIRKCGQNLLYSTICNKQTRGLELMKIFVKKGLDINDGVMTNSPLLHYAVEEDCIEIVEFLLKEGVNVNSCNTLSETPLHLSIKMLNQKGDHCVCVKQYYDLFTLCLTEKRRWCRRWHRRMLEKQKMSVQLLKYGANVNAEDHHGKTPLTIDNIGTMGLIILVKHLAKLSIENAHVSEKNLNFIQKNSKVNDFFVKCKKELELMRNAYISSSTSLYDVLFEIDCNKLVIYTKNNIIKQVVLYNKKYEKKKCPIFHEDLKVQYTKGRERRSLLDLAVLALNRCFHFQIPTLIAEKIMYYLSYEDWIKLINSKQ